MVQAFTLLTILLITCADQLIKFEIVKHLAPVGTVTLIKGFIQLRYVENTGAIFGSMPSKTIVLSIITAIILIIAMCFLFSKKIKFGFIYICLVCVVSGGIGNLIDRIFRGFVVDYIEPLFINFAIFNFADCFVTVGAFAMMGYLIFDLFKDFRKGKV